MEYLMANPGHLVALACKQDDVALDIDAHLVETMHIKEVESTWGPLFGLAFHGFFDAEKKRRDVITYINGCSVNLAAQLRVAADQYVASDVSSSEVLDKQVLDGH